MRIQDFQQSPELFQREIWLPTGSGNRKFGDVMAKFQRRRFAIINPSLVAVSRQEKPPIPRIWDERVKGGSKDTDWAVCLLWLLMFTKRQLRCQVGAYDQLQASEIQQIVRQILKIDAPLNKVCNSKIQVQSTRIINTKTGSEAEILSADKYGSHGSRPDFLLCNELTHMVDKGFAETLFDNLDKMPNGLGVVCSNSGFSDSWQESWKNTFLDSPRWKIIEYRHRPSWIDDAAWDEASKRNSANRFRRLFKGIWTSDCESALEASDIEASITQREPMAGKKRGWMFYGGLDIGLRKHGTGLVIIGRHVGWSEERELPRRPMSSLAEAMVDAGEWEPPDPEFETVREEGTNRLRLAYCQAWKPKPGQRVSLEQVKSAILMAHQKYNLQSLSLDPFQGEMLAEQLQRENAPVKLTPQTTVSLQDQATATVESFQQRMIDLYDHADLIADLRRLQLRDSGLKVRLISPEIGANDGAGTGHGDTASALSFAISEAKSGKFHLAELDPSYTLICE
jgi:terminase large subunit-like protein